MNIRRNEAEAQEESNHLEDAATANTLHCSCHDQPSLEHDILILVSRQRKEVCVVPYFEQHRLVQIQALPDTEVNSTLLNQYRNDVLKRCL